MTNSPVGAGRTVAARIDLDPGQVGAGLAQVVTLVLRLLHELLERQAIRRIGDGDLSPHQIEQLGSTLRDARHQLDYLQTLLAEHLPAEPHDPPPFTPHER